MKQPTIYDYSAGRNLDPWLDPHRKTTRRRFLVLSALGIMGLLGIGTIYAVRRWRYIVIHHSAGIFGNVAFLTKIHRQRQPYDPIDSMAYHFAVGNGNGLKMGAVESGMRWRSRLWGAHVSARNHKYNFKGIGICLVGNYQENPLPREQYDALIKLIRRLMKSHKITASRVFTHGKIKDEHTLCPGKNFPYQRFYFDIA